MVVEILTLVINLDRSTDRMEAVRAQFERCGWRYQRFSAVEPDEVETHPEFDCKRFRHLHNRPIRKGELGCALSHKRCLEKFLATNEQYCLVLEDDVCFDERTFPTIVATVKWLELRSDIRWHCVNLSSSYSKRCRDLSVIAGRTLRRSWQFPLLTSALLWNRSGAEAFLRNLNDQLIYTPVDNQLRYLMGRTGLGLSFDNAPVGLTFALSEIRAEGAADRGMRNGWYDVKRRLPVYAWALWHGLRS